MKKFILYFIFLLTSIFALSDSGAFAQGFNFDAGTNPRNVKVGYFKEPGYHEVSEIGLKSGYGFELIENISLFTGWNVDYVGYDKNFAEMFDLLEAGEIDVLSSINWSWDREEKFLFSEFDVGVSSFILTLPEESKIKSLDEFDKDDFIYIGVRQGDIAARHMAQYAKDRGVRYSLVYFHDDYSLKRALLESHKIDLILSNSFRNLEGERIMESFDEESIYIITRKDDARLMEEINGALETLHYLKPSLYADLKAKYYSVNSEDSSNFTLHESQYLSENEDRIYKGIVTVGVSPLAYIDGDTIKGIIPDTARKIFENVGLKLEIIGVTPDTQLTSIVDNFDADIFLDSLYDFNAVTNIGARLTHPYIDIELSSIKKAKTSEVNKIGFIGKYDDNVFQNVYLDSDAYEYMTISEGYNALENEIIDELVLPFYTAYELVSKSDGKLVFSDYNQKVFSLSFAVIKDSDFYLPAILSKTIYYTDKTDFQNIITSYLEDNRDFSLKSYVMNNQWIIWIGLFVLFSLGSFISFLLYKASISEKEHALALENFSYVKSIIGSNLSVFCCEIDSNLSYKVYSYSIDNRISAKDRLIRNYKDEQKISSYRENIHPEDLDKFDYLFKPENIRNVAMSDINLYEEVRILNDDNEYINVGLSLHSLSFINNLGKTLVIVKDITKAKAEEEEKRKTLVLAMENAKRFSESKTMFLSQMSHDIRTPMNAILGMTSIAKMHIDDKERVSECIDIIDNSSHHLLSLINEILDVSRIESGKLSVTNELISIKDVFDTVVSLHKENIVNAGITCNVELNIVNENIYSDATRLTQVFSNIVSNAAKYTLPGGTINITLTELDISDKRRLFYEFEVKDTGIGMSEEMLKNIFKPFERASEVEFVEGTGLGMTITKNIVDALGGVIKISSEEKKGTTVNVSFGFAEKSMDSLSEFEELNGKNALVLSNDKNISKELVSFFEEGKMKVTTFNDILTFKDQIESKKLKEKFTCVAININVNLDKELGMLKFIRQNLGNEPIVIDITDNKLENIDLNQVDFTIDGFASVPIHKNRLVTIVSAGLKRVEKDEKSEIVKNHIGKRALIVEDVEINAIFAEAIVDMKGLTSDIASNGAEAVKMLEASEDNYYSIVLMDIQMPLMNGYDAAKKIRKSKREYLRNIPIIAMSANAYEEDILKAKASGMNDHISKPVDINRFSAIVDAYVEE